MLELDRIQRRVEHPPKDQNGVLLVAACVESARWNDADVLAHLEVASRELVYLRTW
jgi:hypothetical protein